MRTHKLQRSETTMGKTTYFNDGKPQYANADGSMQPIALSKEDKPLCWDGCWAPLLDCCGMMPYVTGVPQGSKQLDPKEQSQILSRWQGPWQVVPYPPMAIKGPASRNKKFYIQYTDAFVNHDVVILSGGVKIDTHVNEGTARGQFGTADISMQQTVVVPNEGQANKIIMFRSPDGKLYIDNVGSYIMSEDPGKLEVSTSAGWPMILHRPVPPAGASMQRT